MMQLKLAIFEKGDDLNIDDINDFQPHQLNKKKAVYARHLGLKKNNLPTPQTERLRIKEIYDNNDDKFNSIEEEGITSRVEKI